MHRRAGPGLLLLLMHLMLLLLHLLHLMLMLQLLHLLLLHLLLLHLLLLQLLLLHLLMLRIDWKTWLHLPDWTRSGGRHGARGRLHHVAPVVQWMPHLLHLLMLQLLLHLLLHLLLLLQLLLIGGAPSGRIVAGGD